MISTVVSVPTAVSAPTVATTPTVPTVVSVPTAATVRVAPPLARGGWREQRKLLGTTISLLATTGITTVLGLAFWWLAAHMVTLGEIGYGSAVISAMTLVGTFGMAGLNTVLIAHLARRPRDADGLLAAALCTSALISAVLGAGFWAVVSGLDPGLAPYLHSGTEVALFVGGSAITGAALVLDEALLGTLGGAPQLWRNTGFAVAKLIALAGLVMLWHDEMGTPILAAWVAGTTLSLIPVVILLRRRGVRLLVRPQWRALRRIGRASVTNTWLNNALQVPVLAAPMLVTGLLTASDGGAFYVASTVVMVAVMLPYHFTTALYAASTADPSTANPGGLAAKVRVTLRFCLVGGLVAVPLVLVAAHPLLRLFGAQYADRATLPLQLMILGYFGSVLKNHYIALCRISGQITKAAVYASVTLVVRLAAVVAGALIGGLTGVALALLVVMCAEGLYGVPTLWAVLKGREAIHE
jgi:O-antigen/teichoic acid export membrane protein